jgi:septal ring factor EnvC (AmiA/AmiB activator)
MLKNKSGENFMNHHKRLSIIPLACLFVGAMALYGCSSKPSHEEMTQLEMVQSEIKSLEQQKSGLEQEKTKLSQSIAAKESQVRTCEANKSAVKNKLHQ